MKFRTVFRSRLNLFNFTCTNLRNNTCQEQSLSNGVLPYFTVISSTSNLLKQNHQFCLNLILIIPGLSEPPVQTLRFFRNYPFLHFLTHLSFASNKRFLQRPYIVRFIIFNRLFVPLTKPSL